MENNIKSVFSIREAFSFSWKKFKETWQILVPVTIIILIVSVLTSADSDGNITPLMQLIQFVWFIAQIFISMGLVYMSIRIVRGEKIAWTDFKTSAKYFSKFLGAAILLGIPVFVLIIILMAIFVGSAFLSAGSLGGLAGVGIVGMIVGLAVFVGILWYAMVFYFYQYAVIDQNKGPVGALKESFRITKGTRWKLVGFTLLIGLFNLIGMIPFFIGLIITSPMTIIMYAYVYEKVRMHANGQSSEFPIVQPKEILAVSEEVKTPDAPAQ